MSEEFLQYIWQFKLLKPGNLRLQSGEELKIINPGTKNTNAGPDFFNARIKIGNTTWAGNVEMHTNASDWDLHNHSSDNAYNNIILHVVYNNNKIISDKKGNTLPTLEIKGLFDESMFNFYKQLQNSKTKIPCENNLRKTPEVILNSWMERILLERLEKKTETISKNLNKTTNNWDEVFYISLARSMGFGINAEPMELLAKAMPISIINKHSNNLNQIEALLFGQAGMLDKKSSDSYYNTLYKEYSFLQKKYSLKPIESNLWKFLRLRPANFPTIRIAQLCGILFNNKNLFSQIKESKTAKEVESIFESATSEYWNTHYTFGKPSVSKQKNIGKNGIHQIIINTIVPILFTYGKYRGNEALCEKSLLWLEQCPGETNSITTYMKKIGVACNSAWQSQALLELKKEYCDNKKCLQCAVGIFLLKNR